MFNEGMGLCSLGTQQVGSNSLICRLLIIPLYPSALPTHYWGPSILLTPLASPVPSAWPDLSVQRYQRKGEYPLTAEAWGSLFWKRGPDTEDVGQ